MKLIELPDTLAERVAWLIRPVVQPHHGVDDRNETAGLDLQSEWHTVLAQLADWKSNPDEVADEGVLAPPAALVACAEHVAETLCNNGVQPPDTLVTNSDGGIVFRWRLPGRTWSIEIDIDGSIESSLLAGSRLLWRHSIHEHSAEAS
ncbi:MAG TPA: hypothetical protein VMM76_24305 [Pirellulaceae bacterium]|nr:hypothetical protein [Pirellulaceae bacterium]